MEKVRIGVIGCGYMAQTAHIPCLAMNPAAELAAVCSRRVEVAEAVARRWGVPFACGSEEELLSRELDAVFVLTPVQWHLANVGEALKAGKAVFTEKPAAMSVESARKLAAAAAAAGEARPGAEAADRQSASAAGSGPAARAASRPPEPAESRREPPGARKEQCRSVAFRR